MKYISIILIIITFLSSCKTEEDKYPDMVLFEPNMKGDFIFEEIETVPIYYRSTDKYVFFKTTNRATISKLIIYDKYTRQQLKKIEIKDNQVSIKADGSFYGFDEEKQKAFAYKAPTFNKIDLETISLEYASDKTLEKKYADEISEKNIEEQTSELYNFLDRKRYELLKEKVIDKLVCVTELNKSKNYVLHFKNEEVHVDTDYLKKGTFIKSKLKGVEDCKSPGYRLDETDYFNESPLKLIDSVTLDYNFTGNNHFVMGVSSKNLYYYELTLNGKSTKFKFPHIISNVVNLKDEIIFETVNKFYKVSTKK